MQSPAAAAVTRGRHKAAAAAPEKHLNRFVRIIALIERAGNGLGTLVFTWATVVILGGFSTMLTTREFRCATFLALLEAIRMFSQNSRLEYQFFLRTRGAFRRPRLNGVALIVCVIDVMVYCMAKFGIFRWSLTYPITLIPGKVTTVSILVMTIALFMLAKLVCPVILNLFCTPQLTAISLWSPLAAILLLVPCLFLETSVPQPDRLLAAKNFFALPLTAVIIVTVSKLQFQWITSIVNSPIVRKMLFMRPLILFLCMCSAIVILGYLYLDSIYIILPMVLFLIYALIPAAVARVVIAMTQPTTAICVQSILTAVTQPTSHIHIGIPKNCSREHTYPDGTLDDTKNNFKLSQNIFYGIVVIQGALYIVACVLEIFSFIPKIHLVHQSKFRRKWGTKCIDMYYSYIFEQCISGGVLAPRIMELTSFAMDFTNSDSPSNQLNGVRMLHSFLKRKRTKVLLLMRLNTSTETLNTLINMLGWTCPEDAQVRLFATKVIVELSRSLQVIGIHGSMQNISSLLDTDNQLRRRNPLLYTYYSQEGKQGTIVDTGDGQEHINQNHLLHNNNQRKSWMLGCWKLISNRKGYQIPKEEKFKQHDLPVLGMTILETLADCDPDNCAEISRARDLIPKIIGYVNEAHPKILKGSSLKLLRRLSNTGGVTGTTLRQKMSEHPFLLRYLAEILCDIEGSQEHKKLATEILRNLATDGNTRQEIGCIRVIISSLIHAFLAQHPLSDTYSDQSLQITAGQALSVLATESVNNCSAMLKEPGCAFIKELIVMIRDDTYKYVAASLLQNLCLHAQSKLSSSDLTELSHSLREVLERITDTTIAQELEVLIGLSSQICHIVPEDFARELEHDQIKERFVKKLVEALNTNTKPTAHCPRIRRVIVEQVIYMMENNSSYANFFNECQMMEALSVVEETPSKVENYRLFMGNAGLMEYSIPLSNLVARAKELMHNST
uniref:BLE2 protein n=1 Tax=Leersia perrieri TaxID=77586 RepID=A0A0D9X2B3_9ORYZ